MVSENCKETVESRHFFPEKDSFSIAHFVGKVSYSIKDIVAKNKVSNKSINPSRRIYIFLMEEL